MTLVVTAATRAFVAQVSDRRFTYASGKLFTDDANKAVILECQDRTLSFAYSGLGFVGAKRTDDWITDLLTDFGAGRMAADKALDSLATAARKQFAALKPPPADKRLSIAIAGWPRIPGSPPLVSLISNFEHFDDVPRSSSPTYSQSRSSARPRSEFLVQSRYPSPKDNKATLLLVIGRDTAVVHPQKRIRKLVEFLARKPDPPLVIRKLVAFVRRCADHPTEGKYVGRDCMAVFMSENRRLYSYFPEDSSRPVGFAPNFVGPTFVTTDVIVSTKRLTWEEIRRWKREGEKGKPDF